MIINIEGVILLTNLSSRQKQIIEISIKIISERGIQELTLKNLAGELNISEPAIYRHFESKKKILVAVLESFTQQNSLINQKNPQEGIPGFEFLRGVLKQILQKFNDNPAISAVIFSEEIFQNQNELSEMVFDLMKSSIDFFTKLIKRGQMDKSIRSDIEANELTIIVLGSIRLLVTTWRLSGFKADLNKNGEKVIKSLEEIIAA